MIRVLVVDDDFMVAKVHAAFVARTPGFEVVGVAHTGATALVSVATLHPDLVLLDIHLPDISGTEVLRRLREQEPDVDVLVISAAKEAETVRTALRGGVVNYLLKPFDQDALRDRLQRYATTHRSLTAPTVAQTDLDRLFGAAPPARPRRDCRRGSAPSRRSSSRACCGRRTTTCRHRNARTAPGSPGSAPVATWSTSSRRAARRCGCSTARRAGRSGATPGGAR